MEKELNNKYKILVVDDEEDICEILKFNLEIAGYHVETAANAEEALHELCNGYHLILLDITASENLFKSLLFTLATGC